MRDPEIRHPHPAPPYCALPHPRRQSSHARAVLVFTGPTSPSTRPASSSSCPSPPTTAAIMAALRQGLETIYRRGYRFMKGGVMLLDLVDANHEQLSLLDTSEREAQREHDHKLMATLDALNGKMGKSTYAARTAPRGGRRTGES